MTDQIKFNDFHEFIAWSYEEMCYSRQVFLAQAAFERNTRYIVNNFEWLDHFNRKLEILKKETAIRDNELKGFENDAEKIEKLITTLDNSLEKHEYLTPADDQREEIYFLLLSVDASMRNIEGFIEDMNADFDAMNNSFDSEPIFKMRKVVDALSHLMELISKKIFNMEREVQKISLRMVTLKKFYASESCF